MFPEIPSRFSTLPSLLLLVAFLFPANVLALPVLKDIAKRSGKTHRTMVSKPAMKILGKNGDFSSVKRRTPRHAVASAKVNVLKDLSARSAIIIDGVTGETLFAKNSTAPRQPASTIKVLTGIIALKSLKENDSVAVSPKAARQPSSKVYLDQRRNYPVDDLINAVLLASANDASVALAEKIAGSEHSFAKLMTLRAKLWGAKNTVCKTATGLTAKGQSSTARDLAVIFRHAMNDKEFATRMKRTKVRTTEGKLLRNHNKALWQVDGTEGGKTGYTNAARQTYVGKFKRGSHEIIVAIMGSERMWKDIKKLVEYGFQVKRYVAANGQAEDLLVAAGAR